MMDFTKWSNEIAAANSYAVADPVMRWWMPHLAADPLYTFEEVLDPVIYAEDQVIVCDARMHLQDLQRKLKEFGLCLPRPDLFAPIESAKYFLGSETLGGAVALNMPHHWEHLFGNWRDWVIGMRVIQPNGEIIKTGSLAVKNVAGFDIHRFLVGSRGTLGVIAEVTLRVYPLKAITQGVPEYRTPDHLGTFAVSRVIPSEADSFQSDSDWMYDPENFTKWSNDPPVCSPNGWTISSAIEWKPSWTGLERELYGRAKQILDPNVKLYSGAWGQT
jgi:hypothetical protein